MKGSWEKTRGRENISSCLMKSKKSKIGKNNLRGCKTKITTSNLSFQAQNLCLSERNQGKAWQAEYTNSISKHYLLKNIWISGVKIIKMLSSIKRNLSKNFIIF